MNIKQRQDQEAPGPIRYLFDNPAPAGQIRLLSAKLAHNKNTKPGDRTVINLARVVEFRDHFYGKVKLDNKLFGKMIDNFEANTYGQEIYIDVSHNPGEGAAATIKKLFLDGTKFRAEVEWTEYGIDAVKKRGFRYLSIDFTEDYTDPEDKDETKLGAVLFGAALTTRPRVKHLEPVKLSNDQVDDPDSIDCGITPQFKNLLLSEIKIMKKYLKWLKAKLSELSLASGVRTQLAEGFEAAAKGIENDDALKTLAEQFANTGTQLAEQIGEADRTIQLSVNVPGSAGMTDEQVRKILAEDRKAQADDASAIAATLSERQTQFDNLMDEAADAEKGELKSLSDTDMASLREARDLITADMSVDQVKRLAETQITIGGRMAVATQLAERGYQAPGTNGNVHVDVDESNGIQRYQNDIDDNLRSTMAFSNGTLQLSKDSNPFVDQVLAIFDSVNAQQLLSENNMRLGANGATDMSNVSLPVGVQRTVIREALHDLRVLELIQTLTDSGAQATTQIPFETRDTGSISNGGIVYEGQGIHRAGIKQQMDTAYITPMKLAMIVSDEVAHFSRASALNWDAWGRNVAMNARVMRELMVTRICNEMQRAADSFLSTAVAGEAVTPDGTTRIFKTAQFPVIRAHQVKDLQGTNVGAAQNPITVKDGATALVEFDGSGTQAAGKYYRVLNYNLGYIQIVDETGTATAPAGAVTCSYSWTSNVVKVDTDLGGATVEARWNDVLRSFGARKAVLSQERYVMPNFSLMAHTLNDQITNADNFVAQQKRNGTDTNASGDLETIKAVSAYSTNAPGIDLGEERVLLGQRGALSYVVAKPFQTGAPFEAVDSTGKPTGEKQAYGTEFSAIHVPSPLRGYMTSLIAYSVTGRAAV